jgi:hypothetical protein
MARAFPAAEGSPVWLAGLTAPDETRNAFTAFQRGWEHGRADTADSAEAGLVADAGLSEGDSQPDAAHNGDAPSPGAPDQEGT